MAAVMAITSCSGKKIDVQFLGQHGFAYQGMDLSGSSLVQTIFYDDVNKDFGYALQWVIDQENYLIEDVSDFRFNPIGQGLFPSGTLRLRIESITFDLLKKNWT